MSIKGYRSLTYRNDRVASLERYILVVQDLEQIKHRRAGCSSTYIDIDRYSVYTYAYCVIVAQSRKKKPELSRLTGVETQRRQDS